MAITTYAQLQSAVADWLARSGDSALTTAAPDFVALFEAEFTGDADNRYRQMEQRSTATLSDQTIALPTDFLEMRALKITSTDPESDVDYATQDFITLNAESSTGKPTLYTIVGSEILFNRVPDADYTLELDYYKFSALSDANTSNWLLTGYPNVYLYGSLEQAAIYLQNFDAAGLYKGKKDEALMKLHAADEKARWSGSPLVIRPFGTVV